jgi:hypothetical protein
MMEAVSSSQTSVLTRATRRQNPEDAILHKLRVFENRVLRRIFGPKRNEVTGEWRKRHNEELRDLYSSPSIIRIFKLRKMRWAGHVARVLEKRHVYCLLVGEPEGKRRQGRPRPG